MESPQRTLNRFSQFLTRIQKLKIAREIIRGNHATNEEATKGVRLSSEANRLMCALAPYPDQQRAVATYIFKITRDLTTLTQSVDRFNERFTKIKCELQKGPGVDPAKDAQTKAELCTTAQGFVSEVVDPSMIAVMDNIEAALKAFTTVREQLRALGVQGSQDFGRRWFVEVDESASMIEGHTDDWETFLSSK